MNSIKQMMITRANLETTLWQQQALVNKHVRYFHALLHKSSLAIPALLLPAFLAGWKSAKLPRMGLVFRQFGKSMLFTLIAGIKRF